MTTPTDAQLAAEAAADIAGGIAALEKTTVGYVNRDWKTPPAGSEWAQGLAALKAAQTTLTQVGAAPVTPPVTPPVDPPAPTKTSGLGLYQLGGSLAGCSHLDDGTYDVVIGDWEDAPLLAKASGVGLAYTVTYAAGQTGFTQLEPGAGAAFAATCVTYAKANPGLKGFFIDNCDSSITTLLADLAVVRAALNGAGLKLGCNLGSYISGNADSDNGVLQEQWQMEAGLHCDFGMCENWQQFSGGSDVGAVRTQANGDWSGWQGVPASVPAGCTWLGVTYGPPTSRGVYGRASMLTAPGVSADAVFIYSTPGADPYDATVMGAFPNPTVDSAAGTATL